MTILVRPSIATDAHDAVPLIYEAIGDIANRLTGESDAVQILNQLEVLFKRTDNRHSYLNTYVAVEKATNEILGVIVLYTGQDGIKMDEALQRWLENKNAPTIKIDPEAYPDEFYLDTICVHKKSRGLGLGTKLLQFAEEVAREKGYKKLSLNVEIKKDKARRLYEKMGYVVVEPWTIIDEPFYHMVKNID